MAITIDTTAGGAGANSYCSVADAIIYCESRLNSDDWDDASEEVRKASLVLATSLLDVAYNWAGVKTTSTGALRWPRSGVIDQDSFSVSTTAIPSFLAEATAEFAIHLLADDRLKEADTKGFSQLKIGPLCMQISATDRSQIIPNTVDFMLAEYGNVKPSGGSRRLERC